MMTPGDIHGIFSEVVPAVATILFCVSILLAMVRQAGKEERFRILGIMCFMAAVYGLGSLGLFSSDSVHTLHGLRRFLFPFSLFFLPLSIHFCLRVSGRRSAEKVLDAAYGGTILLVAGSWWAESLSGVTFPLAACGGALYCAYILARPAEGRKDSRRLPSVWLMLAGITMLLIIVSAHQILFPGMKPLSFAFIPLCILALGAAGYEEFQERPAITKEELVRWLATALVLTPILTDLVILLTNFGDITLEKYLLIILSFGLAKILAAVVCISLALFIFTRKTDRTNSALISVCCMILALFNLHDIIIPLLPHGYAPHIDLLHKICIALIIGASIHLVYRVAGRKGKTAIHAGYAMSFIIMVITAAFALFPGSVNRWGGGFIRENWQVIYMGVLFLTFSHCAAVLWNSWKTEADSHRKEGLRIIFIGAALGVFLLSFNLTTTLGIGSTHLNTLLVIPLGIILYGLTYKDLFNMSGSSKRKMVASSLRAILVVAYIAISPVFLWLWREYGADYILARIIPYGVPPLLSFICAAFLSLFVLGLEQNRPEAILFSLINFCYALLNLDITLVAVVPDMHLALKVSRLDHFFLSLIMLGVNLHLIYLVTGMKTRWWVVYAGYLAGIVMAPLSQTRFYYQGMYTYYWGLFAHKAILFDIMSALWLAGLFYGIYLLYRESRTTQSTQKAKVRRVLTAFIIMAAFSMSNIPAINGYEIYPLGTFAFVGLIYLAYGLFKFNMKNALQFVRSVLFGGGMLLMLLVIGMLPGKILDIKDYSVALLAGVLGVIAFIRPVRRSWNALINLFISNERDELNEEYMRFTKDLSHAHHLSDINDSLKEWFFRVFSCSFFTLLVRRRGEESFHGWNAWNSHIAEGLFRKADEVPRGEQRLHIDPGHALVDIAGRVNGMTTGDSLAKLFSGLSQDQREDDIFGYAEIMLPISIGDGSRALLILGAKNDGSGYRASEIDIIQSVALVLGPTMENALLLESLEDQVDKRTSDLNHALVEAMVKEKQIVERNAVIERQNRVMAVLLETASRMRSIEGLEELFGFTLSQLRILFPDFRGGIILEDTKRNILEASAFAGVDDAEQKVILKQRRAFARPGSDALPDSASKCPGILPDQAGTVPWKMVPLQGDTDKAAGYVVLKEQDMEGQSGETMRLFIAQISAVVQNRLLLKHLERMASTDGLTGVYNRSFLDRELEKAIRHARRFRDMTFALMIIDVNGLKQINDTYGHGVGDEVIVKVSGMLKAACRETDIVSRIGGDEFAVLMPSTGRTQAEMLRSRIREGEKGLRVLLTPSRGAHINIRIHISIGLASSEESEPDDVMKKADDLMYLDKQLYYKRLTSQAGLNRQ